jgi:hypothetical protein
MRKRTKFFQVLAKLEEVTRQLQCDLDEALFRGHSRSSYRLVPTLLRKRLDPDDERDLFSTCLIQGRSILPDEGLTWRMLSVFQHHGIPTRLLDWSDSFAMALYFALQNKPQKAHIWVANPFLHNQDCALNIGDSTITIGVYPFPEYGECFLNGSTPWPSSTGSPIFIEIPWLSERVRAQRGYFTAHQIPAPLEITSEKWVRRIDIPQDAISDAWQFLKLAGVNDYSVFPDLHGLGAHVKKIYGF